MIKRNMFRGITERSFSGLIWAVVLMCYSMIVIPLNAHAETCAAIDYNITTIDAGLDHTIGLKEDGTVVAVGYNNQGQLNVSSWTNIKAIAAGGYHTVGLKEDGTVVAAGYNSQGQLNVSRWTNIKAIEAGMLHTIGLKEDGTVVAVGYNYVGQLNVSSWTNIKFIAAGGYYTAGLKEDGKVVAVGQNSSGQLNVSSWTNIMAIAAGIFHTVGIKEDGTVVAVGNNYYGQLSVSDWTIRQPACLGDVPTPDISSSTTLIAFGEVQIGSSSAQSITISNTGTADLTINSISISGPDSNKFSQTNNCSSVASNASCAINVIFTPVSLGAKNATLNIASNDPDTPTLTIPLTGTGVDIIPPTTSSMISGVPGNNGWYRSDVQITLTATDNYGGSGVKEIHYSINGYGTVVAGSTASFTVSVEGSHSIRYFAKDNAGNSEAPHILSVKVDKTPPTITASSAPVPNANGWNNSDVAVTFTCNDTISGIASCSAPITATAEVAGLIITGTVTDNAGNTATSSVTLNIDKTLPSITAYVSPTPNAAGWHNTDVTVTFTCSDTLSGIAFCPAPLTVTAEGAGQVITGEAVDKAGNKATASVTLNIDKTPPSITSLTTNPGMLWPPNHKMVAVTLGGSAADYGSDIASVVLSVSDEYGVYNMTGLSFGSTVQLEAWREGTDKDGRQYTISAVVTDRAGNRSTATTAVLVPHDMR